MARCRKVLDAASVTEAAVALAAASSVGGSNSGSMGALWAYTVSVPLAWLRLQLGRLCAELRRHVCMLLSSSLLAAADLASC